MGAQSRTPHPGEMLASEMGELDLTAKELANLLRVPKNRITQIVGGTRSITPDTALRLSRFLGTTAMYWMNLQGRYDVAQAHRALKHELMKLPSMQGLREARSAKMPPNVANVRT